MKLTKRIAMMTAVIIVLFSFVSVSAYAYNSNYTVTHDVGEGYSEFERTYYFDNNKGIMNAEYNTFLLPEAFIRVYHSTSVHYGRVAVDTGSSRTNGETEAGEWSGWASVRVKGKSYANYIAYYYV